MGFFRKICPQCFTEFREVPETMKLPEECLICEVDRGSKREDKKQVLPDKNMKLKYQLRKK